MRNFISKDVTNFLLRKVEMKILMFFNCSVAVPTVAHFIELYKEHCYFDNSFTECDDTSSLKDQFENMILFYQDISLESEYLYFFKNVILLIDYYVLIVFYMGHL